MTTPPASPPSRRLRFIPRQFSLRALLVLITATALFTWWWMQPPRGMITEWQASRIKTGMTRSEVEQQLGKPTEEWNLTNNGVITYGYRVHTTDPDKECLSVQYGPLDDKVSRVDRTFYLTITDLWRPIGATK